MSTDHLQYQDVSDAMKAWYRAKSHRPCDCCYKSGIECIATCSGRSLCPSCWVAVGRPITQIYPGDRGARIDLQQTFTSPIIISTQPDQVEQFKQEWTNISSDLITTGELQILPKEAKLERICMPPPDLEPWISICNSLPKEVGTYLVCCETGDPNKPLITTADYDPKSGWQMPFVWIMSLTHWMSIPKPPVQRKYVGRFSVDPIEYLKKVYSKFGLLRPNSCTTEQHLVETLYKDVLKYGKTMVYIVRNMTGETTSVYHLTVPNHIPQPATTTYPDGWYKRIECDPPSVLDARDVKVIRIPGDTGPSKETP